MWKKRNINSLGELMRSRPGATYELADYRSLATRNLPEITNLNVLADLLQNYLLENRIVIVCDYDTDGIMSGGIMLKALSFLASEAERVFGKPASQISLIVPDRFADGYGFQPQHAEQISSSIILLLDNGICQHEAIRKARENGNEIYIVDHHLPAETLPEANLTVDPWVFPGDFNEYCAAGLCYRLARRMLEADWVVHCVSHELVSAAQEEFLFMAAVATIADVVPLLNENRLIVREGLRFVPSFWRKTVSILCNEEKDSLTEEDVSFRISPAINAIGRLGKLNSEWIMEFILDGSEKRAALAKKLYSMNEERKFLTAQAQETAEALIRKQYSPDAPALVVQSETFHPGIVGIVAGRLSEIWSRPVFVFGPADSKGLLTGSGRSKDNPVHLKKLLDDLSVGTDCIVRCGGHASAAGVTIRADRLETFAEAVSEYAWSLEDEYIRPDSFYDFELDEDENWAEIYSEIRKYAPFGAGNPEPVFHCRFTPVPGLIRVLGKDHVKIRNLNDQEAVGFGMMNRYSEFDSSSALHLYGSIAPNRYCGGLSMQFIIRDLEAEKLPVTKNETQNRLQSLMDAI